MAKLNERPKLRYTPVPPTEIPAALEQRGLSQESMTEGYGFWIHPNGENDVDAFIEVFDGRYGYRPTRFEYSSLSLRLGPLPC